MAVESRFVVIRQGAEVQTFMDKRAADEYDKMLDMADSLAEMLTQAPVELSEQVREELGIYFAQHRDDVLVALQAKKGKPEPVKVKEKDVLVSDINKAPSKVDSKAESKAVTKVESKVDSKIDAKVDIKAEKKPAKTAKASKVVKADKLSVAS